MNLPNKITLSRVIIGPLLIWAFYSKNQIFVFSVVLLQLLGDMVDGYFSRKYQLRTEFGRVLDPFVDFFIFLCALTGIYYFWNFPLVKYFLFPLAIVAFSFLLPVVKGMKPKMFHAADKIIHTAMLYVFFLFLIFSPEKTITKVLFWISFAAFFYMSLGLLVQSVKFTFKKQSIKA